jgi:hypothetical protein
MLACVVVKPTSGAPRALKEGGACLAPFLLRCWRGRTGGEQNAGQLLDGKRIGTTSYDQLAQMLHFTDA